METQSHKYEVSLVTPVNITWFVETAAVQMLTEELKVPEWVNIPHLYKMAQKVMEDETAFVVSKDGQYCGAIAGMAVPNLYDPSRTVFAELFWYVVPEYRESRAGALLLASLEQRAQEVADEMTLSLIPNSSVNFSSLRKRGFFEVETAFRKTF